ncbi:MAG TPA: acetyl-CoA C-acetyltransferase, partial [Oceanicaulis sp.]|nr:acetyl-CoA C-acetyltransferase [Oceanicaulis sp.]
MSAEDPIVIVGMARTPMGGLMGELAGLSANELGAEAVKAALAEAGVAGDDVDLIYMGNVLSAGQGQAPARQAAIKGGLPKSVEATTLNKMCGSGMQAVIMAHDQIKAGTNNIMIAG